METLTLKKKSMLFTIVLLFVGTILYGHEKGHDRLFSHHENAILKDNSESYEKSIICSDKHAYPGRLSSDFLISSSFDSICSGTTYHEDTLCLGDSVTLTAKTSLTYDWQPKTFILAGTDQTANAIVYPQVTTTYTVSGVRETTGNLITNGSFEQGNAGFHSDYDYNSYPTAGKYYITDDPNAVYHGFAACNAKHGDSMMLVNGEESTPGKEVWYDTINIQTSVGDSFYFSFWATSVDVFSPAVLKVYVEGDSMAKTLLGTLYLTSTLCAWIQFESAFTVNHQNQYLRLSLVDSNMSGSGNDFALDSFWFSSVCNYKDYVTVRVQDCKPCEISVSPDQVICDGDTLTLNAEGGLTYSWTPTQYIVPGTENTANPQVFNPVPTYFKVNGIMLSRNLIANGSFEQGNVGFHSDYEYNSYPVAGKYYISDNPAVLYQDFSACSAKEGDSMMVVNGEDSIWGMEVWYDTIDVQTVPGDSFYFSFWATSIYHKSPAILSVYVEGDITLKQLIGKLTLTSDTCVWDSFGSIVQIAQTNQYLRLSIVDDRLVASGNDFALDDMRFSGFCQFEDSVFVDAKDRSIFESAVSHSSVIENPEEGNSIKYTNDCGFIGAVRSITAAGLSRIELLKLDITGSVVWNKMYLLPGVNYEGNLLNVEQTSDGGYVSCGWIHNAEEADTYDKDYYILKTDADGVPEWAVYSRQPLDEAFHDIEQTSDGGYVAVGYTNMLNTLSPVVVRLDADGNTVWSKTYFESESDNYIGYGRSIDLIDENGDGSEDGYAITGYIYSDILNYKKDVLIMRINLDGSVNWVNTLYLDRDQEGRSIIYTSSGKYVVTGYTEYLDQGSGLVLRDLFLLEYDLSLGVYYFSRIGSMGYEDAYAIEELNDGTFVIAGETKDVNGQNHDALLLNVMPGGSIVWSNVYGDDQPENDDWARSVDVSPNGDQLAVIGCTSGYIDPGGDYDYYILNTDINGVVNCTEREKLLGIERFFLEPFVHLYDYMDINMEPIETVDAQLAYTQEFCQEIIPRKSDDKQDDPERSFDGNLQVYPVPVDETKQLNFDYQTTRDEVIKVSVVDLLGNVVIGTSFVANKEIINSYQLDLSKQSAGTYILKVQGDQKEYTSKIMIVE